MITDRLRLAWNRGAGNALRTATIAIALLFSLASVFAQDAASNGISNWHAMGSAPCVMQDQPWEKDTGPIHPLDVDATIKQLRKNGFDCYVLGISTTSPYSLNDLNRLLPALEGTGISVWAELFPPEEKAIQLPYKLDYVKWMGELGRLSLEYPALRGVNIDDYLNGVSSTTFSRDYTCRIYGAAKQANPKLLFVPTIYELESNVVNLLSGCVDGVWLWWTNLDKNDGLRTFLEDSKPMVAGHFPIYTGLYAHSSSWHQKEGPKPKVLREALEIGCRYSDGVVLWNLPLGSGKEGGELLKVARDFAAGGTASLAAKCGLQ